MKVKFRVEMNILKKDMINKNADRAMVTSKLKILKKANDETKNCKFEEKSFSAVVQSKRSS